MEEKESTKGKCIPEPVALRGVLSAADQAINALEKLADHHEAIGKRREAMSNRQYISVIKGQMICHKLAEGASR